MKRKIIILIGMLYYICTLPLLGQNSEEKVFQIHAPTTYALAKYGEIPVNHSTGIPSINLPLLSLQDRDVGLDVSLAYHAGGIKVDEEATWVGLGWSLNAGGMITRVLRGVPDFPSPSGGLRTRRTAIDDFNYRDYPSVEAYCKAMENPIYHGSTDQTDNGADLFYFNFCGMTGCFFFDDNMNPVFTNYQDFKVEYNYIPNASLYHDAYFTITDTQGIKYEFKEFEATTFYHNNLSCTTAWYLTKIIGPAGGEINLTYATGGITTRLYQKRVHDEAFIEIDRLKMYSHLIPAPYNQTLYGSNSSISGVLLKEITAGNGSKIKFTTGGFTRKDVEINNGSVLTDITSYGSNGTQQKKFKFTYTHFEADNAQKIASVQSPTALSFLNYRLRLDSFCEVSTSGELLPAYKFGYYGDSVTGSSVYHLPHRLSAAQDHWGYYNYASNKNIFPNHPADEAFRIDEWFLEISAHNDVNVRSTSVTGGANREPHSEAVKAGSLQKIIYPTGGSTEFEYDTFDRNIFHYPSMGGLRIKKLTDKDAAGGEVVKTYNYTPENHTSHPGAGMYHSIYFRPFNTVGEGDPELMMAFGIPYNLADKECVLKINAHPLAILGNPTNGIYYAVEEHTNGNGHIVYTYSNTSDYVDAMPQSIDGVSTTGGFNSAYVYVHNIDPGAGRTYTYQNISSNIYNFPFPDGVSLDWKRGNLVSKKVFDSNRKPINEHIYTYESKVLKAVAGYKVRTLNASEYIYARSYTLGGMNKLKKEVSRMYNPDGSIKQEIVKEHSYDSPYHKLLTKTQTGKSTGGFIQTEYYYPTEYGNLFTALKNKNILKPIDVRNYDGSILISGEQTQYNDKGLPVKTYVAEPESGNIKFDSKNAFTFTPDMTFAYNDAGLLQSQTLRSGMSTVFLWSYKNQFPIAEIKGATVSDVQSAANSVGLNLSTLNTSASPDMDKVEKLRGNSSLSKSLVTVYHYDPAKGITRITNSQGFTSYYDYDNFNRLKEIYFMENGSRRVLENYQYNYKK